MVYQHKGRASGAALRELMIDKAVRAVEEGGADALSASAVSRAVGAKEGASYTHFPDGATELLAAVAIRAFARLKDALDKSPNEAPEARIREVFQRYVRFGLDCPHLYRAMYSQRLAAKLGGVNVSASIPSRGATTYEELMYLKIATYEAFAEPCRTMQQNSALRSPDHADAAKAVATLAHGLVLEFIDEGIDLRGTAGNTSIRRRLALAARLLDMLLLGVIANHPQAVE